MVDYIRSDLEFILDQIKIAEAHAAGQPLYGPGGILPAYNLSLGLRTVDGSYNNLLPGREYWGASNQPFTAHVDPVYRTVMVDPDGPGPSGPVPMSYAPTLTDPDGPGPAVAGDVMDPALRTISNLIVDQTLSNPAAIIASLTRNGVEGDLLAIAVSVKAAYEPIKPLFKAVDAAADAYAEAKAAAQVNPTPANNAAAAAALADLEAAETDLAAARANDPDGTGAALSFDALLQSYGIELSGANVVLPNVATDEGLSAPFNSWFTLFGQFFDHGLDLINKGGSGTVFVPLAPDDPLYVAGSSTNFMVLTRATVEPGEDGVFGTADDVRPVNTTTPFVDQNQTYASHPSHQVFLREYALVGGRPEATGHLIEGANGGMASWGELKQYASTFLGIQLTDQDVGKVPLLRTDAYGNFIPAANGFPQVITGVGADGIPNTADDIVMVGNPAANGGLGISLATAIRTTSAFLADIAHNAVPNGLADGDLTIGLDNGGGQTDGFYDNELLDEHFIAGDGRVNENVGLTAVHHIFHAEHNRMVEHTKAVVLATGDPAFIAEWLVQGADQSNGVQANEWNGERLFQAAKFGTEMQYQHLVFEEFARKVQPSINVFIVPDGYDADINPSIMAEFAHVVYRFGHSMLTETIDRYDATSFVPDHISLIEGFLNPVGFDDNGAVLDGVAAGDIVRGMTRQQGNHIDEFVTSALRNNLLGLPLDLATINLARGRDTGVPTLNAARREFYEVTNNNPALKPYESWVDFAANLKNEASIINFIAAYGTHPLITGQATIEGKRDAALTIITGNSVGGLLVPADAEAFLNATGAYAGGKLGGLEDIDLWIGGLAEQTMPFGGMLGSTFNFVFEVQMESLQNGDRFYYLQRNTGQHLFESLEANSLASLIMRHTDATHLPADVFSTPGLILEVDQTKQFNDLDGNGTLESNDPTGGFLLSKLVIRNDPSTPGVDTNYLRYTGGDHVLLGGTNNADTLIAGIGDDTIYGDGGNDRIEGGFGNDLLQGGDGDDIITDIGGDDVFKGGKGNDAIHGGSGVDLILAGDGNDFVVMGNDEGGEAFGGQGNDFILSTPTSFEMFGNEGDDWIENGANASIIGDNLDDGFQRDAIRGNDVLVGVGGMFDEFIGEGGDDIMVGSLGPSKMAGMSGFDWATFKNMPLGVAASLLDGFVFDEAPVNPADTTLNRFESVEGLSGSAFNDVLIGSDFTAADRVAGGIDAGPRGSVLDAQGIALINGLQAVLGAGVSSFSAGDIILGGDGNDVITGGAGDDIIDGDKWLNVRISVRANPDGTGAEIATANSMTELTSRIFDGTFNPGQLVIVREILTANGTGDVDAAVFSGAFAEYDIVANANGTLTVTHSGGTQLDGSDTLRNIEELRFTDRIVSFGPNATGAAVISDLTPTEGQPLTVNTSAIVDPDGLGAFSYQWQSSANGTTWLNVGANSATFTPNDLAGVTPGAQAGQQLRVIVSYTDPSGNAEAITSAPTGPVGLNWDGIVGVNNVFAGNAGDDIANGANGNDTLNGNDGNDVLTGGGGNDNINGGGGNDRVNYVVGDGSDTVNGGGGTDTLAVTGTGGNNTLNVVYNGTAITQVGGGSVTNIESVTADLGGGTDALVYATTPTSNVTVNLATGTASGFTTIANIENVTGGGGNDTITGSAGNNSLTGGDGADILAGLAGTDTLTGGNGDDVMTGGAGNDTIDGRAGNDVAAYVGAVRNFDFGNSGAILFVNDTTGAEGFDLVTTTETLRFDGVDYAVITGTAGGNTLTGTAANNAVFGFEGDDAINGGGGNDIVIGGAGNDTITQVSTDGRDIVDGGAGTDTYVLNGVAGAETFNIYTRAAWLGLTGNTAAQLHVNTEIVIASGQTDATVIAELDNIEEITVNSLATTAQNGDLIVNGGVTDGDTVNVVGNFNPPNTSLAFNTITVNGGPGNETVNISQLNSDHRVVFNSGTGVDNVIGTVRPQDTINMLGSGSGTAADPADASVAPPIIDSSMIASLIRDGMFDTGGNAGFLGSRSHGEFGAMAGASGVHKNPMFARELSFDNNMVDLDLTEHRLNDRSQLFELRFDAADHLVG